MKFLFKFVLKKLILTKINFMKKNIFILEDKSPLNQKINDDKNKQKYISFSFKSFLFISFLLNF